MADSFPSPPLARPPFPGDAPRPQPPLDALLAALPSLLAGLLLFLPGAMQAWNLLPASPPLNSPISLAGIIFFAAILAGLFFAWRQGWPAWGGAYYFFGWMIPFIVLISLLNRVSSAPVSRLGTALLILLIPALLAIFCFWLAVNDRLKYLLALLPIPVLFWPTLQEFVPAKFENLEFTAVYILTALVAFWIARRGDWRLGMWLALGLNLLVGVSAATVYELSADYPGVVRQITFSTLLDHLAPVWLAAAAMLLCPLLLASLHTLGLRSGLSGRLGFWLVFAALLAWMVATIFVYVQGAGSDIPFREASIRSFYQAGSLACGAIFLVGAALLIYAALTLHSLPQAWASVLLTLLPAGMPWLFALLVSGPLGGNAFPQPLVYGLSFAWVLLSAWLVTYIRFPDGTSPVRRWGGISPTVDSIPT